MRSKSKLPKLPPPKHVPASEEPDIEHAGQYRLWSAGLKATPARAAVITALQEESRPISIADLHKKPALSSLNKVTLYRTLDSLADAGLVSRVNTGDVHASYELISGRKHHHHLICTQCREMEDVEVCLPPRAKDEIMLHTKKFYSIGSHSLEFFGLCNTCFENTTKDI